MSLPNEQEMYTRQGVSTPKGKVLGDTTGKFGDEPIPGAPKNMDMKKGVKGGQRNYKTWESNY